MQLFYVPELGEGLSVLPEEEARHCVRTLRKQVGDEIHVMDGKGHFARARIEEASKRHCSIRLLEKTFTPRRDFYLHIAIAPTKNISRLEWFLEKSTELGIDEISLIACQHSERRRIRLDRLEKVVLAAAKQSLKAYLPQLNDLQDFGSFITTSKADQQLIAHCYDSELLDKQPLKTIYTPVQHKVLLLIGPEGDFSEEEVQKASANGFYGISLGDARLRTETAGLAACHSINFMHQ